MRHFDKDTVTFKLAQRGIKIKEGYIVIPKNELVGIKTWGMIDFLKIPWHRQ